MSTRRTSTSKEATGSTIHNIAEAPLITGPRRAKSKINWHLGGRVGPELAIDPAVQLEHGPVAVAVELVQVPAERERGPVAAEVELVLAAAVPVAGHLRAQ